MKKILHNRLLVSIICLLISLAIGFIAVPYFTAKAVDEVEVVKLNADIPAGTKLTDAMLEVVKIPKKLADPNYMNKKEMVVEKYALTDLFSGEYLLNKHLSAQRANVDDYLYKIPDGYVAISATLKNFSSGLSGKLMSGDIISIFTIATATDSYGAPKNSKAFLPSELKYVRVLSVSSQKTGSDIVKDNSEKVSTNTSQETKIPDSFTVLLTPEQAKVLVDCETAGYLHTALVSRGDEEKADKLLKEQIKLLGGAKKHAK